jgi:agmatine deiminase
MAAVRQAYAEVAQAIAAFEPVTMIARPELIAEASLHCGKGISILPMEHDDSWARDVAPTFVLGPDGRLGGIDWRYDGYGGRAPGFAKDARLASQICERLDIERFAAPIVLEGGALHVDGEGTALVCAESVLDPLRNRQLDRAAAETILRDYLGVEAVIWLTRGLIDDDTAGHVDNLACFVRPGVVLALVAADQADPQAPILAENLEILRSARDARGRALVVQEVAAPAVRQGEDGRRLAASYINFYLANGAVIMPMFNDPMDQPAYRALAAAFPDRTVVQIDASDLIHGGGGIHCITQQQPAPPVVERPG